MAPSNIMIEHIPSSVNALYIHEHTPTQRDQEITNIPRSVELARSFESWQSLDIIQATYDKAEQEFDQRQGAGETTDAEKIDFARCQLYYSLALVRNGRLEDGMKRLYALRDKIRDIGAIDLELPILLGLSNACRSHHDSNDVGQLFDTYIKEHFPQSDPMRFENPNYLVLQDALASQKLTFGPLHEAISVLQHNSACWDKLLWDTLVSLEILVDDASLPDRSRDGQSVTTWDLRDESHLCAAFPRLENDWIDWLEDYHETLENTPDLLAICKQRLDCKALLAKANLESGKVQEANKVNTQTQLELKHIWTANHPVTLLSSELLECAIRICIVCFMGKSSISSADLYWLALPGLKEKCQELYAHLHVLSLIQPRTSQALLLFSKLAFFFKEKDDCRHLASCATEYDVKYLGMKHPQTIESLGFEAEILHSCGDSDYARQRINEVLPENDIMLTQGPPSLALNLARRAEIDVHTERVLSVATGLRLQHLSVILQQINTSRPSCDTLAALEAKYKAQELGAALWRRYYAMGIGNYNLVATRNEVP